MSKRTESYCNVALFKLLSYFQMEMQNNNKRLTLANSEQSEVSDLPRAASHNDTVTS